MLLSSSITTMYLGWTRVLREALSVFLGHHFSHFSFNDFFSILLLSSGVTTMSLGWIKSRGSRGLREPQSNFLESEVFPCNLFYFILKIFIDDFLSMIFLSIMLLSSSVTTISGETTSQLISELQLHSLLVSEAL